MHADMHAVAASSWCKYCCCCCCFWHFAAVNRPATTCCLGTLLLLCICCTQLTRLVMMLLQLVVKDAAAMLHHVAADIRCCTRRFTACITCHATCCQGILLLICITCHTSCSQGIAVATAAFVALHAAATECSLLQCIPYGCMLLWRHAWLAVMLLQTAIDACDM